MPLIEIDFDATPDKMLPLSVGLRTLDITDIETSEDEKNPGSMIVTAEFKVNEPDSEEHERKAFDRFHLHYAPARTKFKQLCKSAGHGATGKGIDASDLIGCTVKALVAPNHYKDKDTGETVENTQTKRYVWDD